MPLTHAAENGANTGTRLAYSGHAFLARINAYLMRWSRDKYKRLRGRKRAQAQWEMVVRSRPKFFAHWIWVNVVPTVW